jgi:hypothetical protein
VAPVGQEEVDGYRLTPSCGAGIRSMVPQNPLAEVLIEGHNLVLAIEDAEKDARESPTNVNSIPPQAQVAVFTLDLGMGNKHDVQVTV